MLIDDLLDTFATGTTKQGYTVTKQDDSYLIDIDLPGRGKDDVSVDVKEDYLVVDACAVPEGRRQRDPRNYWFQMGDFCDVSNISAEMDKGVLTIRVPLIQPVKRRIEIAVK